MLHADDVIAKVFREKLRGYDQGEVDEFLDQVADALAAHERRTTELASDLAEQQEAAFEAAEAETLLKRTLLAAQRTADDTVARAKEEAAALVADAHAAVEGVHTGARREAAQIVDDATRQATELVAAMRRQIRAEQAASRATLEEVGRITADMHRLRDAFRSDVRAALEARLAALEGPDALPPPPVEAAELAARAQRLAETLPPGGQAEAPAVQARPQEERASEPGHSPREEPDVTGKLPAAAATAAQQTQRMPSQGSEPGAADEAEMGEERWGGWFGDGS